MRTPIVTIEIFEGENDDFTISMTKPENVTVEALSDALEALVEGLHGRFNSLKVTTDE